jgi:hypothetical protein
MLDQDRCGSFGTSGTLYRRECQKLPPSASVPLLAHDPTTQVGDNSRFRLGLRIARIPSSRQDHKAVAHCARKLLPILSHDRNLNLVLIHDSDVDEKFE